jgi:hypothetical protein
MTILNEIEFLEPKEIIPHEEPSIEKLNALISKIKNDGFINHPILTTKIKNKIIILDGTHRFFALKNLNVKFIPIQLVNYHKKRIKLSSWAWQFNVNEEFKNFLKTFDLKITYEIRMPKNYEILIKSKETFLVKFSDKFKFLSFLNEIKNLRYERVLREQLIEGIIFPKLNHNFFLFLAKNNLKIPSGITRFKVQNRILYLKVPLNVLNDERLILEFKEHLKNRKFRIYEESVLVFEE